jgi:hypothetical protein
VTFRVGPVVLSGMPRTFCRRALAAVVSLALAAVVSLALAACHQDGPTVPVIGCSCVESSLMIVNAQSSAIAVDTNGVPMLASVAPGSAVPVPLLSLSGVNLTMRATGDPNVSITYGAAQTGSHTAIVYRTSGGALAASFLTDSGATVAAGKTKMRILHLAPNAGRIDVFRTQPDWGTPISFVFPFTYGTTTGFYESTQGSWHMRVWKSTPGLDYDPSGWGRAFDSTSVFLYAGQQKTIAVLDAPGNTVKFVSLY